MQDLYPLSHHIIPYQFHQIDIEKKIFSTLDFWFPSSKCLHDNTPASWSPDHKQSLSITRFTKLHVTLKLLQRITHRTDSKNELCNDQLPSSVIRCHYFQFSNSSSHSLCTVVIACVSSSAASFPPIFFLLWKFGPAIAIRNEWNWIKTKCIYTAVCRCGYVYIST